MSDYIFSCRRDEETKEHKFYSCGFFNKKRVSDEDFFCFQRKMLKEKDEYRILPRLEEGVVDTITYLYQKSVLSRQNNWESDFGKRVKVKAEFVKDESNYQRAHSEKYFIPRYFFMKVWIYDEASEKNHFKDFFTIRVCYSDENFEYWNYSEEYIALLIRNAINGNLQTARDIEETMLKRNEDIYLEEGWPIMQCDECGEKFLDLNSFFCHLLEEGHYDSFLDEFPNDREVQHIKNMLDKKKSA